jgi:hypothetical protein
MVDTNYKSGDSKFRCRLTERLREINENLPSVAREIQEEISGTQTAHQSARAGLIFFANAPISDRKGEQEAVALVMLLRREGKGLWTCCKISVETSFIASFDLLLDPEEWTGGFPVLLQTWNTITLHEEDMDGTFHESVSHEIVCRAEELYHAFRQTGEVPHHLRHETGRPLSSEDDPRWQFRNAEMETLERVRLHYHEGWKGLAGRIKKKLQEFVESFTVTLVPVPVAASDTRVQLDLNNIGNTVLIRDDIISVVVSQQEDRMFLRLYPKGHGESPDEIRIQGKAVQGEKKGAGIEVPLGTVNMLPGKIEIIIGTQERRYLLHVSFATSSTAM